MLIFQIQTLQLLIPNNTPDAKLQLQYFRCWYSKYYSKTSRGHQAPDDKLQDLNASGAILQIYLDADTGNILCIIRCDTPDTNPSDADTEHILCIIRCDTPDMRIQSTFSVSSGTILQILILQMRIQGTFSVSSGAILQICGYRAHSLYHLIL